MKMKLQEGIHSIMKSVSRNRIRITKHVLFGILGLTNYADRAYTFLKLKGCLWNGVQNLHVRQWQKEIKPKNISTKNIQLGKVVRM